MHGGFLKTGRPNRHSFTAAATNAQQRACTTMLRTGDVAVGKVVTFTGITKLDLPADRILENAIGELDGVVILGYQKDGEEFFASSYADGGDVLWLLERCKKQLLEIDPK
jgi:hypothetical protein